MPLSAGTKLGPYEITAPVGAGGMGEVYRARDSRLDRVVAIKVSQERFSERFEREAKAIAALNHPNICTLHDVGPDYLVMEYVEGTPLKGPLPFDQALKYAVQICDALDAAHKKGITHRDLKPANILVTKAGIKLLDFGLAKLGTSEMGQAPKPDDATLTMALTRKSEIVGTLYYMSPEQLQAQANGQEIDGRSDIFSFGIVLHEILTGKRAFEGSSPASVIAAIMERPAPSIADIAPPALDRVLRRCLAKDPDDRWQTARDLKAELEWILGATEAPSTAPSQLRPGTEARPKGAVYALAAVAALAMLALALLAFAGFRETPPEARLITAIILPPEDASFNFTRDFNPPAISPNGRQIVFGVRSGSKSQLWVRPLDSPVAQPLAGTENATFPFWSPDNKSIAFFADGKLKRIEVAGGSALTIADAPNARGGAWNPEGVIVYAPAATSGLQRVAATGGTPTPATVLAPDNRSDRFPWFLPDGRHFLFETQIQQGSNDDLLRIASLDSKEVRTLGRANSNAVYAQGHLLFLRELTLLAQPFDAQRLATTGDATPVGERVQGMLTNGVAGVFSVSRDGILAYQTGSGRAEQQLVWFDRSGKRVGTLGDAGEFGSFNFSPDHKSLAVSVLGPNDDLWIYEVGHGLRTRFTFNPTVERDPVWSPDGRKIVFRSDQKGHFDLYRKSADLAGTEEILYADGADKTPDSWSADGKFLLFTRVDPKTKDDIWVLPLTPDAAGGKPFPYLQTPSIETEARFSPDGKWVAYVSDDSQRDEVYVAPFPGPGGKRQISTAGGNFPRWREDGRELFYMGLNGVSLMTAEVSVKGGSIEVGAVRSLGIPTFTGGYLYDVSADGQRFLLAAAPEQKSSAPLTLVYNWTMLLKR